MKENLNYFSEKEKGGIHKFVAFRDRFFSIVSRGLTAVHISPNIVSLVSLLLMGGFVYYIEMNPYYALIFVALHILLDGIDGPLARYQKKDGDAGALVDIFVDQGGLVVAMLSMIYFGLLDGFWAAFYLVMYLLMIMFLVVLNRMKNSVRYVIRTKYFFYCLIFADHFFNIDSMYYFLPVFAVYMLFMNIYMFNKLRCSI